MELRRFDHALIKQIARKYNLVEVFCGEPFSLGGRKPIERGKIVVDPSGYHCIFLSVANVFLSCTFRSSDTRLFGGIVGAVLYEQLPCYPDHANVLVLRDPTQYLVRCDLREFAARRGGYVDRVDGLLAAFSRMDTQLLRMDVDYPWRHENEPPAATTDSRIAAILSDVSRTHHFRTFK